MDGGESEHPISGLQGRLLPCYLLVMLTRALLMTSLHAEGRTGRFLAWRSARTAVA